MFGNIFAIVMTLIVMCTIVPLISGYIRRRKAFMMWKTETETWEMKMKTTSAPPAGMRLDSGDEDH